MNNAQETYLFGFLLFIAGMLWFSIIRFSWTWILVGSLFFVVATNLGIHLGEFIEKRKK